MDQPNTVSHQPQCSWPKFSRVRTTMSPTILRLCGLILSNVSLGMPEAVVETVVEVDQINGGIPARMKGMWSSTIPF